jgi:hypothetical protein
LTLFGSFIFLFFGIDASFVKVGLFFAPVTFIMEDFGFLTASRGTRISGDPIFNDTFDFAMVVFILWLMRRQHAHAKRLGQHLRQPWEEFSCR